MDQILLEQLRHDHAHSQQTQECPSTSSQSAFITIIDNHSVFHVGSDQGEIILQLQTVFSWIRGRGS